MCVSPQAWSLKKVAGIEQGRALAMLRNSGQADGDPSGRPGSGWWAASSLLPFSWVLGCASLAPHQLTGTRSPVPSAFSLFPLLTLPQPASPHTHAFSWNVCLIHVRLKVTRDRRAELGESPGLVCTSSVACMCVCVHACVHKWMCIHVCMHMCGCACRQAHLCMCTCACSVCAHVYTYICASCVSACLYK